MSEKKAFIFGSRWGEGINLSYYDKNIQKHIVFAGECHSVTAGSYIILKDQGIFKKIGIAKSGVKQAPISELGIFDNQEESKKYNIKYNTVVKYVEIQEWLEPSDTTILENLISGSYYRSKNGFSPILNSENRNLFNEFLKINSLWDDSNDDKDANDDLIGKLEKLLTSNHNLILTGVPGTGKTYLAKQIAAKMIFGEDITLDNIENDEAKKAKFEYQYKFVQFHPSYDYTDFVEGIRPVTKEDNSYGFVRKDGTFKEFCKRAIYINIDYNKLLISKLKEFCEYLLKETINKSIKIENIKGSKDAAAPIKTVIYNQDNETIKIIVDTVSGNNGISSTSLHKIAEWYLLYITKFLELNKEQQNMKTFDSTLGITYGGSHTYIYGFIKLFHDKYGKELQVPSYYTVDKDDKTPFIFVIDEINRGDINKILGELFYAIDTGYRGEKGMVDTQYQNLVGSGDIFAKGFYIPENVYIIGTMNDIDRSVESMDFAIRRRFAWKEITPKETAEDIFKAVKVDGAYNIFNALNNFIASAEGLGKMYQIGASYFLKLNSYVENSNVTAEEAYKKLWDNHLKGLFFEYVRGKKNGGDIFSNIENTYFNTVNEILA